MNNFITFQTATWQKGVTKSVLVKLSSIEIVRGVMRDGENEPDESMVETTGGCVKVLGTVEEVGKIISDEVSRWDS